MNRMEGLAASSTAMVRRCGWGGARGGRRGQGGVRAEQGPRRVELPAPLERSSAGRGGAGPGVGGGGSTASGGWAASAQSPTAGHWQLQLARPPSWPAGRRQRLPAQPSAAPASFVATGQPGHLALLRGQVAARQAHQAAPQALQLHQPQLLQHWWGAGGGGGAERGGRAGSRGQQGSQAGMEPPRRAGGQAGGRASARGPQQAGRQAGRQAGGRGTWAV